MRWAASQLIESDEEQSFERLVPRLLDQIWDMTTDANESIIDAFADFFVAITDSSRYFSLGHYFEDFLSKLRRSNNRRRRLIIKILERSDLEQVRSFALVGSYGRLSLLGENDLEWLVAALAEASLDVSEATLIDIIVNTARARDLNELDWLWERASNLPNLQQRLTETYSVTLASSEAKWLREDYARRIRAKSKSTAVRVHGQIGPRGRVRRSGFE